MFLVALVRIFYEEITFYSYTYYPIVLQIVGFLPYFLMFLYGGMELNLHKCVQCGAGDSPTAEDFASSSKKEEDEAFQDACLEIYNKENDYILQVVSNEIPVIQKKYINMEYQLLGARVKIAAQTGLNTDSETGIQRFLDCIIRSISGYLAESSNVRSDF